MRVITSPVNDAKEGKIPHKRGSMGEAWYHASAQGSDLLKIRLTRGNVSALWSDTRCSCQLTPT